MNEQAYREGFDRGNEGKSSASGILDGWFDSDQDSKDRDDGYKAGLLANAIRGDDE
jgi:hypothetical protein